MKSFKLNPIVLLSVLVVSIFILNGCTSLDVVGKAASQSFKTLIEMEKKSVSYDEKNLTWIYKTPTGDDLRLSADASLNDRDVTLALNAQPFLDAGLNTTKLPKNYLYNKENNLLLVTGDLGNLPYSTSTATTMSSLFNDIVKNYRASVGYHEAMDHYGLSLGNGNQFEWAKDFSTNDKDIVFVLNPEPLIQAGLEVQTIKTWIYAEVETKDSNGAPLKVFKLLLPQNLK